MSRKKLLSLLALLLILAISLQLQPVSALSKPVYPPQKYPKLVPDLIEVHGNQLIVHDLSEGAIQLISLETWEARSLKTGRKLNDLAVLGDWLAIAPPENHLLIYDLKTGERKELEMPGMVDDLEPGSSWIWATIPRLSLVAAINPSTLEIEKKISLDIASGRDKLSIKGKSLWAIKENGKKITRISLESGDKSSLELEEPAVSIKAFNDGALVATTEDKLLKLSNNLKILKEWILEKGSATDIQLYPLEDGRIIYVSPSRWIIGEIDGDKITEVKTEARIGGSALAGDRIWFTEPTKMRIGYAPLSRLPMITEFKVEKIDGNLFKAIAEVEDPDGDLSKVYLIVFYPELVGPAQNRSYEMELENGVYFKEFEVEYGRNVEVHASAIDAYGNAEISNTVKIRAEKIETTVSQQTTQTSQQTAITPAEVYALGSSLLLLIPIIIAIAYLGRRRRKRRRR